MYLKNFKILIMTFMLLEISVLTTVTTKSTNFWHVSLCSLVEIHRHFRETCYCHLQGISMGRQYIPPRCQ